MSTSVQAKKSSEVVEAETEKISLKELIFGKKPSNDEQNKIAQMAVGFKIQIRDFDKLRSRN